jgi:neurotransmitter:Na+ symporter, NSS family
MSENKTTWKSQSGYVWALIGSAVGFANILSFSAQVYKNGGGAFLIPYCMALFLLGIPFLLLEGLVGYRWKAPLVTAYGHVWGKAGRVLGWLAVLACLSIGAFYIVLTGYSLAYTFFAASNQIPEDSKTFFLETFLQTTSNIGDFGHLSIPIFLSTAGVLVLTWFVLVRNVRDGIEKICSFFMPILAFIMAAFALTVCFLPGGLQGLVFYLKPDFSRLLDPMLWRDVFGQLFFSLSLGLGIIVGYSRHTAQKTNISRAMMWVVLGDSAVSFIAGFAIFGCLAHISYVQNIPFESILNSDSTFEIGFILFPKILKFFGPLLSQVIGVIFFSCVFIAGITGVFSIVESIAGNVEVEFKTSRKIAVTATILALMCMGIFFCMGNASHLIDALAPMVVGTNMLIGGLVLILAFMYTSSEIRNDPVWKTGGRLNLYGFSLIYIAPVILAIILMGTLYQEIQDIDISKGIRWTWLIGALLVAGLLVQFSKAKHSVHELSVTRIQA